MTRISTGDDKPLKNKRVLIAASPQTSERLQESLKSLGARLIPFQGVDVRKIQDREALARALGAPDVYAWLIFTSSYGVRFFLELLDDLGLPKQRLAASRICAVGPATARTASDNGLRVDLIPDDYVAEGILRALSEREGGLASLANRRILLPRAREARDLLPRELRAAGINVTILPCYETFRADVDAAAMHRLIENPPDLLVFTSTSNVTHFMAAVGHENGIKLLRNATVAVLGPVIAKTVASLGKDPEIRPDQNTAASLILAIQRYFTTL